MSEPRSSVGWSRPSDCPRLAGMFTGKRPIKCAILALAVVMLLLPANAAHAMLLKMSVEDMAKQAETIVVAKALETRAERAVAAPGARKGAKGTIQTKVTLEVDETLKGDAPDKLVIATPGGRVGDTKLTFPEAPKFKVGETSVLFLDAKKRVIGWRQGKLDVESGSVPSLKIPLSMVKERIAAAAGAKAKKGDASTDSRAPQAVRRTTPKGIRVPQEPPAPPKDQSAPLIGSRAQPMLDSAVNSTSRLFYDSFESGWGQWSRQYETGYTYTSWGDTAYRYSNASRSAYCVGYNYAAPGPYPNNVRAWMITGPFDLSDAVGGRLWYDYWLSCESGFDWLEVLASPDGSSWYGVKYSPGTGAWATDQRLDLGNVPGYGSMLGDPSVWIAFRFVSDSSITAEGAYVDYVELYKDVSDAPAPAVSNISPGKASAGTNTSVTISGTDFGATQGSGLVEFYYDGVDPIYGDVVSWSDTSITVKVPTGVVSDYMASASSGPVRVRNDNLRWSAAAGSGQDFDVSFGYGNASWGEGHSHYWVNPNCADTASESALTQAAAGTWNPASAYSFNYSGTCSTAAFAEDGWSDVFWTSTELPTGVLAATAIWEGAFNGTDTTVERDVGFNDYYTWGDGSGGTFDVQTIALHEYGHWLTLLDLYGDDAAKIMYGYGSPGEIRRTLHADDEAGIAWIYGPPPDVTPPPAPTVSSDTCPNQDIWYDVDPSHLSWTCTDPSGIAGFSYALDQSPGTIPGTTVNWPDYEVFLYGFEGEWWWHLRAQDNAGNWGPTTHFRIRTDTTDPSGSMSINGGAANTNTTSVTLNSAMTDMTAMQMRFSNDNASWSDWVSYSATRAWTLTAGDGSKTVYAQYKDAAGNTAAKSDTIVLDTAGPAAPTAGSSSHPDPSAWYTDRTVDLNWSASDPSGIAGYSIVIDQSSGTTPPTTVNTAGTTATTTSLTDGEWYFHVRAKDNVDNWGPTTHFRMRIDGTAPTGSMSIDGGAAATRYTAVTLNSAMTDMTAMQMRFSNDNASWSDWVSYSATRAWTLTAGDGSKTVYAQYKDAAGNTAAKSDTIVLDTAGPDITSLTSPTHPVETDWYPGNDPRFDWTAPGDATDYSYAIDTNPASVPDDTGEGAATTRTYADLASGTWYFHVKAKDSLGNWGATSDYRINIQHIGQLAAVSSSAHPAYGAAVTITATLRDGTGVGVPAHDVTLQRSTDGVTWLDHETYTSATELYAHPGEVPIDYNKTYYRVAFAGDPDHSAAVSNVVTVLPKAWVKTPTAPRSVRKRRSFTAYGYLKPRHTAGSYTVRIQCYRKESGRWKLRKTVSAKNLNYSSYTKYQKTFSLPYTGSWRLRGTHPTDSKHYAYSSSYKYMTVKR